MTPSREDIVAMARQAGAKQGIENEADAEFLERFFHAAFAAGAAAEQPAQQQEPVAGLHAVYFRNNWDGEGDLEYVLAHLSEKGEWTRHENGAPLIEFRGDEIIKTWPLTLEISAPNPAQPSKPWVGLTEFDIDQIPYSCSHADSRLIAFAIEAKLREKNQ